MHRVILFRRTFLQDSAVVRANNQVRLPISVGLLMCQSDHRSDRICRSRFVETARATFLQSVVYDCPQFTSTVLDERLRSEVKPTLNVSRLEVEFNRKLPFQYTMKPLAAQLRLQTRSNRSLIAFFLSILRAIREQRTCLAPRASRERLLRTELGANAAADALSLIDARLAVNH